MFPSRWSQLACRNIAVNQLIPHGSAWWHAPVTAHG